MVVSEILQLNAEGLNYLKSPWNLCDIMFILSIPLGVFSVFSIEVFVTSFIILMICKLCNHLRIYTALGKQVNLILHIVKDILPFAFFFFVIVCGFFMLDFNDQIVHPTFKKGLNRHYVLSDWLYSFDNSYGDVHFMSPVSFDRHLEIYEKKNGTYTWVKDPKVILSHNKKDQIYLVIILWITQIIFCDIILLNFLIAVIS